MSVKIMVLGGGYAGVLTAKKIAKQTKKMDVEITLIDRNPFHTMLTELHEVAAGRVSEDAIKIDLKKIFAGRDVNIVCDEITAIDFEGKSLTGNKVYDYDFLVLGAGSKPTFFGVQGAHEHSFTLWSYDDAVRLKAHILDCFRRATRETNAEMRRRLLTFCVVGCGFTGVEMAGELAEWIPILCKEFCIAREDISLINADVLSRAVPALPEKLSAKVQARLTKMGAHVMTETNITAITPDGMTAVQNDVEQVISSATVIWTAGVESADITTESASKLISKGRGRIVTDSYLRAEGRNDVFIAGDNIFYIPAGEDQPVPQMVENAEHSADVVSHNLVASLKGGKLEEYKPKFHGMMVCIGGRYGTAFVGFPGKMFALPSFLAMLSKHLINMMYFIQICGWNRVYTYLLHEFFHMSNRRSFVGGLLSTRSPNFWLVPLRLFVGGKWLIEGYDKLLKVIADPEHIFLFNLPDAVASASLAGDTAVVWGEALPVPEWISTMVDWSMGAIIAPVAPLFQAMMVLAEVAIGLALVLGVFTAVASCVSVALCGMIYVSGMAPPEILWYAVAGIALIGGSGSVLGVDYYLLPLLKRWWQRVPFVKKWYLYND